jgi:hypothetical protein
MKRTPKILAALFLGAVVLGACSSSPSKSASTTTTTAVAHHSTTTSSAPATTTSTTAAASAATTSTTPAADAAPQNESATAQVKSSITAAYVVHNGLPAAQVAGPAPGTVYYAYVPQTKTYWAIASFVPTPNADMQTQVAMQDDGCCGIFTQASGAASWTFAGSYLGAPCPGTVPLQVLTVWNLPPGADCPNN